MFLSRVLPLLLGAALAPATSQAASVSIAEGTLATVFDDFAGTATVNESASASFDLSDLSGLLPGEPIQLSFIYDFALIWLGTIEASMDPTTTVNWAATFDVQVGGFQNSVTETQSFGPGNLQGGGGAFATLSGPNPLTLEVPWGTDLGNVTLTLTDHSSITGIDAKFVNSRLRSMQGTLRTSSIPEPAGALLALTILGFFCLRRTPPAALKGLKGVFEKSC